MRAIFFAMLANGHSRIHDYLDSPDTDAMINACRQLGASIELIDNRLEIKGVSGRPKLPSQIINVGNSGQVLRFIAAIAGLIDGYTILTGDDSICHRRPMQPLLDGLEQLGCFAKSSKGDGHAPIMVKGPLNGNKMTINGMDSQPVSGLLMMAAFAPYSIELWVDEPGEKPWVDLTLDWFKRLKIPFKCQNHEYYQMQGNANIAGFEYLVPGDFSSAAFPLCAAAIAGEALQIDNIDMSDVQGDKRIVEILMHMGAPIEIFKTGLRLKENHHQLLHGFNLNINDCIDALPILTVLACYAATPSSIRGAGIARHKESDRISSIASELRKMGANLVEHPDGLDIIPVPLKGAEVQSHQDHRIAMALAIAGLNAQGMTHIVDAACIDKSYPEFVKVFQSLGARIE